MSRRILLIDIGPGLYLSGVLPAAAVGANYTAQLTARGGRKPYTYEILDDALADSGLSLDPAGGLLTGTATTGGRWPFVAQVTDAQGNTARKAFVLVVVAQPLQITGAFADGKVGANYSSDLSISGGVPPYKHPRTTSSELPPGLSLSIVGSFLRLSGSPTSSVEDMGFTVAVDDSADGTASSNQSISVDVTTDPQFNAVVASLHFDGAGGSTAFMDQTGRAWMAIGNAQIDNTKSKFGGGSGLFDGAGDAIQTAASADFSPAANDFTIEAWLYNDTPLIGQQCVMTNRPSVGAAIGWRLLMVNGKLNFLGWSGGDTVCINLTSPGVLPASTWTHVAMVYVGDTSTWTMFIGGAAVISGVEQGASVGTSFATVYMGTDPLTTTRYWNGRMDDVRVTKGVARYTADFTPPVAAFPNQ